MASSHSEEVQHSDADGGAALPAPAIGAPPVTGRKGRASLARAVETFHWVALALAGLSYVVGPWLLTNYQLYLANLMQVNVLLAVGMNVVIGMSRQFALSSGAMLGMGAYTSALLQVRYGLPFVVAVPAAILAASALSAIVSMLAWRVGGLYLAMVTFGFGEIFQFFLVHADVLTRGPDGLTVLKPIIAGQVYVSNAAMFRLVLPIALVAVLLCRLFERSGVGLRMMALGDSEIAVASIGHEPRLLKTIAFAIQGAYAGCAGALFASIVGFIDPYSFGLPETLMSLTAVAVGGLGSLAGSIVGGVTLTLIDRALIDFPGARELAYGVALLIVFMLFPTGLAGLWGRWKRR